MLRDSHLEDSRRKGSLSSQVCQNLMTDLDTWIDNYNGSKMFRAQEETVVIIWYRWLIIPVNKPLFKAYFVVSTFYLYNIIYFPLLCSDDRSGTQCYQEKS